MPSSIIALLAVAFQIGPFYQQKQDYCAVRPFVAVEDEETDVLWPVFTYHRDWWRFCYLVNWQSHPEADGGYQFSIVPLWFNGRYPVTGAYAGLFPIYGHHPHIGMMYDVDFALFPLWFNYEMPRVYREEGGVARREWLKTNTVLFPFFSWRSDGAWSFWPVYGVNYKRESDHRYVLWPLITWADYREDRDTAGAGYSWMVLPFYGRIRREREDQDIYLPPFFSYAKTYAKGEDRRHMSTRLRCPWPLVDYESTPARWRISVWPFYERSVNLDYIKGKESSRVTRFGWKLVEIYDDEVRVFPFWASASDHTRFWPFWETEADTGPNGFSRSRFLALFPIRWVPAIDRNWSKFWTFYENASCPLYTDHSLLWGIFRWRTMK